MNKLVIVALALVALVAAIPREKRQTFEAHRGYALPDGVEFLIGSVRSGFSCANRIYGYYADVGNACQIFHVCLPIQDDRGQVIDTYQYSFICGNQTIFDQANLVCAHPQEALPCEQAENFYTINQNFGIIPQPNIVG